MINITKDNNTRSNTGNRACTNTKVSHPQSTVTKVRFASEHKPWDENVVSNHYIDDVQLTDCVTDEFNFPKKKEKMSDNRVQFEHQILCHPL